MQKRRSLRKSPRISRNMASSQMTFRGLPQSHIRSTAPSRREPFVMLRSKKEISRKAALGAKDPIHSRSARESTYASLGAFSSVSS